MKRNRKRKRTKRTGAKRRHIAGRAYDTGHGGSKATKIKMALSEEHVSCWVHKNLTVTTKRIQALLTAARASGVGRKGRMSSTTDRYRARILDGHRNWQIGRLRFPRHTVTAGDGSNQKGGEMGAGYMNLQKQRKRQQRKVRREEEGSSSNRPELAAFVLALRGIPMTSPMLYLCDNQALLKAVKRWVGEGGKKTLVGAPDADILLEAIEEL